MAASTPVDMEQLKAQRNVAGLTGVLSQSQDADLRKAAAQALGEIRGAEAARALVFALSDADEGVRGAAGQALRTYKSKEISKTFQEMMKDPDQAARDAATQGMMELLRQKSAMAANRPEATKDQLRRARLVIFLVGAAAWFAVFVLSVILFEVAPSSSTLCLAWFVLPLALLVAAVRGWNVVFVDKRYHTSIFESIYKGMVVVFIGCTMIGMIWVSYWTGKSLVRLWYRS